MALTINRDRVRIYMIDNDIQTYRQLAETAGISEPTLYNVLSGEGFNSATLEKLARGLNVNPLDLITITGHPAPHVDAPACAEFA